MGWCDGGDCGCGRVWDRGPRTWTMMMRAENQVKREQRRDDSDIKCGCLKQEGKYSNEERDGRGG